MGPLDLRKDADREGWRAHLAALLTGRRVIAAMAPLAGLTGWVGMLDQAGAERPLLVATGTGAGPAPTPEQAEWVLWDLPPAPTMTEDLRRHDALVRDLPEHVRAAVLDYDPDGAAAWLVGPFVTPEPILGRDVLGGRPAVWAALEDKLVAERIWAAIGIPRAPSQVSPVAAGALRDACADLDQGAGVVLAGDARDGFNGGGEFVRWVQDEADRDSALAFFGPRCDRVRVMPFLEGVPCSIHGLVLPEGTAVLRPVELAILRDGDHRFVYGGLGTTWDPAPRDREQMRELARRTGEHLRGLVGYRGGFGVDGVLTADGFRPTELNARLSAGIVSLGRALDPHLIDLLQLNLLAGRDPGVDVASLESWAVPALDESRFARAVAMSERRLGDEPVDIPVQWDGSRLSRSPGGDPGEADTGWTVSSGPSSPGTFSRLDMPAPHPGVRVADLNVALMRLLDTELGAGFGAVSAAPDVCR